MSYQVSVGLSALRAAQVGIDIVGQNIANANTPGYHRQVMRLASRLSININGQERGTGVEISHIDRIRSGVLELSVLEYEGDFASVDAQLETARHIETLFASGAGSLSAGLNLFYQRLEELSARPHDETSRREVIRSAAALTQSFRRLGTDLDRVRQANLEEAGSVVEQINILSEEIGQLNLEISTAKSQGRSPHDLQDRRDALTRDLAQYLDVAPNSGNDSLAIADGSVLVGRRAPAKLELRETSEGVQLFREGDNQVLSLSQGRLSGMLHDVNATLPDLTDSLDLLARGVMATLDTIHAQGVGLDGPFDRLVSQRVVADVTTPILSVVPDGTVKNGSLPITVIDQATGERTLHEITIDPAQDSLEDIAAKLTVPHVLATVDPASGNLSIQAEAGYAFDFTGIGNDSDASAVRDESGLLAALGMNTFFVGSDSRTMAINPELDRSPSRLATSLTGQPADSNNLTAMIASRFDGVSPLGGRTSEQFIGELISFVGSNVSSLEHTSESLDAVRANLDAQIASVSGVNPDEEVLRMLQYQRAYEAAARFLSVVNETTLELMQII